MATSAPPEHPPLARPPAPRGSSTGALWTAGLGAFLLFAAAATFVAVRWGEIPDSAKFGALVAVTGLCLAAHQRLRSSLPITATALFHLGVLLVPVDVAAVGVWSGWEWPRMLFAQGLAATVTFGVAAQVERSVVLRWATWAGVVTLAGGIGGVTSVPAGLVLAGVALTAAAVVGPQRPELRLDLGAGAWAVLAGFATPLAAGSTAALPFESTLRDLGLVGSPDPTAAATGLLAGLALGVLGARRRSTGLVLTGLAAVLVGAITTWVELEPSSASSLVAVAALCLAAQLADRALGSDPFWGRTSRLAAEVGIGVTTVVTIGLGGLLLLTPFEDNVDPAPVAGLAAALVATTWLVSSLSLSAAALSAGAAAALATGRQDPTALTLAVLAGAVVLAAPHFSRRPSADQLCAVALVALAPLAAMENWALGAALAVAGALAIAEAAVHASRAPAPTPAPAMPGPAAPQTAPAAHESGPTATAPAAQTAPWPAPGAQAAEPASAARALGAGAGSVGRTAAPWPAPAARVWTSATRAFELAMLALTPLLAGTVVVGSTDRWLATSLGLVVTGWAMALVLDRATQTPGQEPLATIPRIAVLSVLFLVDQLTPAEAAGVAGLIAALALLDAVRLREPVLLVGVGAAAPVVLVALAVGAGWTLAEVSMVVAGTGLVWLGLAGSLPGRWAPPALVSAVIAAGVGLSLGSADGVAFSVDLLIVGAGVAAVGLVLGQLDLAVSGGAIMTAGTWGLLAAADVTAADAYVAPVSVLLVLAGIQGRRLHGIGSWLALAPAVALLGGTAAYERLAGGSAGHAALAGAVGVVAVVAGGAWRLAGPLLVGTVLVVAVTVHETLGVAPDVPSWAWLAAGGVALLAAGVAMERHGVGPVETGRRLVDVVNERFD